MSSLSRSLAFLFLTICSFTSLPLFAETSAHQLDDKQWEERREGWWRQNTLDQQNKDAANREQERIDELDRQEQRVDERFQQRRAEDRRIEDRRAEEQRLENRRRR